MVAVDFGPIIVVFVLLIVLPVTFLVGGAVVAIALSMSLKSNAEATHEGSELIDLNN
jgi:flagellar basal body-associated protein FliL